MFPTAKEQIDSEFYNLDNIKVEESFFKEVTWEVHDMTLLYPMLVLWKLVPYL